MTTSLLLLLDLALGGLTAAAWGAACVLALRAASRRGDLLAIALVALAVVSLAGQFATAAALAVRAFPLAQEKLLFADPLQLLSGAAACAVALPALIRRVRAPDAPVSTWTATVLVAAAAASGAGILARAVVGYPMTPVPAAALAALVLLCTWLAHALLSRGVRREVLGAGALIAVTVVAAVGYSWLTDVAVPVALAGHAGMSSAAGAATSIPVTRLRTPEDAPGRVRHFDLTARHETATSAAGRTVDAWTFGSLPGPELRVEQGDLVEVTLRNQDIAEGVSLHWHGYDVPNGEDGVAGATQAPVLPGQSFTYRFVAEEPGTYWYHTHQMSAEGIRKGLFGLLIVLPPGGIPESTDLAVPVHTFGSTVWLGDTDLASTRAVAAGQTVRLRLVNTDQVSRRLRLTGGAFRVVSADGRDLEGPQAVRGRALRLPAGGRLDLSFAMPAGGVLLSTDASSTVDLALAPPGADPRRLAVDRSSPDLDLLSYGRPAGPPPPAATRNEMMVLDRLPRFFEGSPLDAYTVNGKVFPHIGNIEVDAGDVVRVTIVNRGWDTHPMHLHGHSVLVLSRNGTVATGSPLRLDTFDVQPGEVWVVQFVADNPGIWLDHCHNLDHAAQGMMMAVTYRGVTTPFDHTHISG